MMHEALPGRLVEAELALEVGDEGRVEALGAAVAAVAAAAACSPPPPPTASLPPPVIRAVAPTPRPDSSEITRSTGPPGSAWMTTKLISRIPSRVGITSSRRRVR